MRNPKLTSQGEEVLMAIYSLNEEWSNNVMSRLNPEQLVEIFEALEEIGNVLETLNQNKSKRMDRR